MNTLLARCSNNMRQNVDCPSHMHKGGRHFTFCFIWQFTVVIVLPVLLMLFSSGAHLTTYNCIVSVHVCRKLFMFPFCLILLYGFKWKWHCNFLVGWLTDELSHEHITCSFRCAWFYFFFALFVHVKFVDIAFFSCD